ncbi:MAG TPA: ribosome recycling factor [Oligoflexia bacterium]|nr:ribosome recycling factor [Oligoflexia bacterium]HMP27798.1 ribosome recycling factor [Oligoflexia bacterium]
MDNLKELENKCKQTLEHFKKELARLRSGRASATLLDGIVVDYYGAQTPLIQLGHVTAQDSRTIVVQVYDAGAIDAVEKAIRNSGLGLNPAKDGAIIRINIPPLTEERRRELVKQAKSDAEVNRVALRNHRRESIDVLKKAEKDKKVSEDESKRKQDQIQKICDNFVGQIDNLLAEKEKELMEV